MVEMCGNLFTLRTNSYTIINKFRELHATFGRQRLSFNPPKILKEVAE